MRLKSQSILMGASLWMALSLVPAQAEDGCDLASGDVAAAAFDDLEGVLFDPACHALRDAALDRLTALLSSDEIEQDFEPEQRVMLAAWVDLMRARLALDRGDTALARQALERLDTTVAIEPVAGAGGAQRSDTAVEAEMEIRSEFDDDGLALLTESAARVLHALEMPPRADWAGSIAAPGPDWKLYRARCGMGVMMFVHSVAALPSEVDVLRAQGQPELALQKLLHDQWTEALGHGLAPPALRELGELTFGADAFAQEIEHAVASIRIEQRADGRYATTRAFGLELPLPLGTVSVDETVDALDTPAALGDWLRRLLSR